MSSLLGFRSSRKASASASLADGEYDGGVSIVSITADRTQQLGSVEKKHKESGSSKKKKFDISCAQSVMSDVTFNAMPAVVEEKIDLAELSTSTTHEFVVECENGERIYVPSSQGILIKSRCRHFRLSLGSRSGACSLVIDGTNDEAYERDNRVIKKDNWSPRTARHVIELLTEGTTWIENNNRRFVELLKACDEISVPLCLGSIINYHDVLDPASSLRFFKLNDSPIYRFKLAGTIQSWQWMHLLQKGVLLHLDSAKVLMLSSKLPNEGSDSELRQKRLSKCDDLYSEFSVYSEKSKVNTLYTIFDLLSATSKIAERKGGKSPLQKRSAGGYTAVEESFRIIYKTQRGALKEPDLNMLWRMTSASYTLSTIDEQRFLPMSSCDETIASTSLPQSIQRLNLQLGDDFQIVKDSVARTSTTKSSGDTETNIDHESVDERTNEGTSSHMASPPLTPQSALTGTTNLRHFSLKQETRTITGTSFAVLQHLFDPINSSSKNHTQSSEFHSDPSHLPACLSIENPTPDTLGRFLNACETELGDSSKSATHKIGYHISSSPSLSSNRKKTCGVTFFVAGTTKDIKGILKYMADYSKTSIVGDIDFKLEQLR